MLKRSAKKRLKKLQNYDSVCDCIPACTSVQYDMEITQSVCDFKKTLDLRLAPVHPDVREAIRRFVNIEFALSTAITKVFQTFQEANL